MFSVSMEFPYLSHVCFDFLRLFDGHVFPRFRIFRVSKFPFDVVDAGETELTLQILQWNANSDSYERCMGRFLNNVGSDRFPGRCERFRAVQVKR